MITISFYVILFGFLFFLLAFLVFTLINISHLLTTGTFTKISFAATVLFALYSVIVIGLTAGEIVSTDWQHQVVIWDSAWLRGTSSLIQPY